MVNAIAHFEPVASSLQNSLVDAVSAVFSTAKPAVRKLTLPSSLVQPESLYPA